MALEPTEKSTVDPDLNLVNEARQELPYRTQAFEVLMQRHDRLLFHVCLRLLGNDADAEDACQEIMVKAFNALPKFEGRANYKTWLMRIATNTCNTLRSKLARQREMIAMVSQESKLEESTIRRDSKSDTVDAETLLSHLGDEDRQLLTLRFVADLGFEEIAEISGLKLSATKMRVYRAAEKLREIAARTSLKEK